MNARQGFSLLEVILAMAVATVSLSLIGSMLTSSLDRTQDGVDLTMAQLLCESISAQIAAGVLPADPVVDVPVSQVWAMTGASLMPSVDEEDEWLYSVQVLPVGVDVPLPATLVALEVAVYKNEPGNAFPVTYRLTRWIRDPGVALPEESAGSP